GHTEIQNRTAMLPPGVRPTLAVTICGPDLRTLQRTGQDIERALARLPGTASVYAERSFGGRYLDIRPDIQVAPPKRPLGVDARRAREARERALDVLTGALEGPEVGAADRDREGGAHAGREHGSPVLDLGVA